MNKKILLLSVVLTLGSTILGCATESHQTVVTEKAEVSITRSVSGKKIKIAIGQFANHSSYQNGLFADGVDRLGSQSETILITSLQQAGCYMVLDRNNMDALARESGINKKEQKIQGARYLITGDIVEFGRKTVGDHQLFGILGHGKKQVAYANVNLNIVDIETSAVVYSSTGAGEYSLSNRDILGFGSNASYDSTLNGKVLSLAIREAVNNLTHDIDNGLWSPE
ncbi:MAG: CsgG/HfaB family protein [Succinivibrionaceae bacterium]